MRLALRCLFALVAADGSIVNVIEDFRAAGAPDARIWVDDGGGGAFGRPGAFGSLNLTPQPRGLRADYVVRTDPDFQYPSHIIFMRLEENATDCRGATHISLRYKVLAPQSQRGAAHFRLTLLDSSDCPDHSCTRYFGYGNENYYSFHHDVLDDGSASWRELKVPLCGDRDPFSPFWNIYPVIGMTGNGVLDPQYIQGWRLEFAIQSSADGPTRGSMLVDRLACVRDEVEPPPVVAPPPADAGAVPASAGDEVAPARECARPPRGGGAGPTRCEKSQRRTANAARSARPTNVVPTT